MTTGWMVTESSEVVGQQLGSVLWIGVTCVFPKKSAGGGESREGVVFVKVHKWCVVPE